MALAKSQAYQDAPATLRAYTIDIANYRGWCDRHGFVAMPATPEVVEAYLVDGESATARLRKSRRSGATSPPQFERLGALVR